MEEKEINEVIRKYEFLNDRSRDLVNQINQVHSMKEKLRAEYESLTGKDISERHKSK